MSIASAQAANFCRDVANRQRVFTVLDDGSFLVFKIREQEVVPFWSTRSRIEKVQAEHEKYRKYAVEELTLAAFFEVTLADLEIAKVHVGLNWSGPRLTGYDISPAALRKNIEHRLSNG